MARTPATRSRLGRVLAAVAALLVAGVLVVILSPSSHTLMPGAVLTSATDFSLSGTVTGLTPGVASPLVIQATNPYNVPITVTSVAVSVSSVTTACPVSELSINGTAFSGTAPTAAVTLSGLTTVVPASGSANIPPSASDGVTTITSTAISSATLFTTAGQYVGWSITDSAGAIASGTTITAETAGAGHSATLSQAATVTTSGDTFTLAPSILVARAAPNACQVTTFNFSYSGSATYTEPTLTSLMSAPNPSTSGQSVTFTATVTGNITPATSAVTPVGTVTFYECTAPVLSSGSAASSCTTSVALSPAETVNGSGVATYATTTLATGSDVIFAVFTATDPTSFATSSSTTITQVVTSSTVGTTTTLGSAPNPSVFGGTVVFTATVAATSGSGTPTGTVNFYTCASATNCSSPTLLGSGTLSSGKATYSTSSLPVGNTYLEAVYQGVTGSYSQSTSSIITQVVTIAPTATSLTSTPNPSSVGSSVTFTATVTPSPSGTVTGTVSFYSCTTTACATKTLLGTGTVGASNKATYSTSSLPVGTTIVEAVYGATTDFSASTSNTVSQVVNLIGTTTALASSSNPSTVGSSVTFTATVTPAVSGTVTGTVSFYSCTTSVCTTKTLLGTGSVGTANKATFATSSLPVGTTIVEAVYGGSTTYGGSTSNTVSQVVNAIGTTTALSSSPNPSTVGSSVTFTATVTPAVSGTVTGTVSFYSCTTSCTTTTLLGTGSVGTGNKATYSTSSLPVGTTIVEAIYGGSATYGGSISNTVSQVVNAIGTSTALSSSPNPSGIGNPVTLTATVTKSSGTATPTGTVSFYSGTPTGTHTLLGTSTLSSGTASLVTSSLSAGTDSLYAVYSGDSNYATSTSAVITQVVIGPPSICTGSYTNTIIGNPSSPLINGTNGNDFIYAFGGSYAVNGFNGNDCLDAGDGNNVLTDGNGNDVILAGNGNNGIVAGNGNDAVVVGNGSNGIALGNGTDSVTVGNGSNNGVLIGNGTGTVTVGSGSYNVVTLGTGTDTVTIQGGSHDTINGGAGNETIYLGAGTYNTYSGAPHETNVCHLPTGKTATSLHDTITNCTVVSP